MNIRCPQCGSSRVFKDDRYRTLGTAAGAAGGAAAGLSGVGVGAAAGAAIGSVVPVIGSVIGARPWATRRGMPWTTDTAGIFTAAATAASFSPHEHLLKENSVDSACLHG